MSEHIFMHYRPEEKAFVQRLIEIVKRVSDQHVPFLSNFYDPRQIRIANNIARTSGDVIVVSEGGWHAAERRRVLFTPDYYIPEPDEIELSWLRLEVPGEYVTLKHGDYLGALTGLGLKREKIGDLSVWNDGCDLVVEREVEDFFRLQLNQVGRASVRVVPITKEEFRQPQIQMSEKQFTVMSLRLDAVASESFQLSRSKVVDPIRSGKLQLNWQNVTDPAVLVEEGDVISLRGMGRIKVLEIGGLTKKGRTVVTIGKYL